MIGFYIGLAVVLVLLVLLVRVSIRIVRMADAYDLAGRLAAVTSGVADPRCWTATTGNAAPPPPPCWPSPTA
jgi:hypothetical protein